MSAILSRIQFMWASERCTAYRSVNFYCSQVNATEPHKWKISPELCRHMASLGHSESTHFALVKDWPKVINWPRSGDSSRNVSETKPPSVQIKPCKLFGATPLSQGSSNYILSFGPRGQTSMKFGPSTTISVWKMQLEMSFAKWWPFCLYVHILIAEFVAR